MRSGIGPADAPARARHRGARRPARRRAQPAEPSGAVHRRASAAARRASRKACAPCRSPASASRRACPAARRPTCSSTCRASRRGMRWARRSPTSARCCGSRSRAAASRSPSRDASQQPLVEFNFVDDERDLRRLKLGFRWIVDFSASEPVRPLSASPFPVRFTDRLRRLNQKTTRQRLEIHRLIARLLNLSPAPRATTACAC